MHIVNRSGLTGSFLYTKPYCIQNTLRLTLQTHLNECKEKQPFRVFFVFCGTLIKFLDAHFACSLCINVLIEL